MDFVKVLRGVLVLRRIAAPHMAASQTETQVNPGISSLNAIFANVLVGILEFDLIQM